MRSIQVAEDGIMLSKRNLNRYEIEWHKKYTFALACLIFLLIGAPLGAIIRKGGLGMPLVVSVLLFIFYWIMSTTGEKVARDSASGVWHGVWFSTLFFLPAGIYLLYKAANDSIVFNIAAYGDFFKKLMFWKKKPILEENIEG
jgi:lipopolysaccharide export system permease protein